MLLLNAAIAKALGSVNVEIVGMLMVLARTIGSVKGYIHRE
jgi:hypothetical protein